MQRGAAKPAAVKAAAAAKAYHGRPSHCDIHGVTGISDAFSWWLPLFCASFHPLQHVFPLGFRAFSLIQSYESTWEQLPPFQLPLLSENLKNLNTKSSLQCHQKIFGDLKQITPFIRKPQKLEHQIIITVMPKSIWRSERNYPFYPKTSKT